MKCNTYLVRNISLSHSLNQYNDLIKVKISRSAESGIVNTLYIKGVLLYIVSHSCNITLQSSCGNLIR